MVVKLIIFRLAGKVQEKYIMSIFITSLTNKLMLCTFAFQITKVIISKSWISNRSSSKLIFQMKFVENPAFFIRQAWVAGTEIFLLLIPNFFSDRILTKSELILQSSYSSIWYEQNKMFKKSLLVFMEQLKNPIKFGITEIFDLNLEKFLETCNAIYSLYNVLCQLNE
jgi:hypothetical protein